MIFLLMTGFAFTMSAQDYVSPKEAVQKLEVEINNMNGQQGSSFVVMDQAQTLRLQYFTYVNAEMHKDLEVEFDTIFDNAYNALTKNGQSKRSAEVNTYRAEVKALLEN